MKKLLVVLCASLLSICCLTLAACGGGGASSSAAPSASSSTSSSAAPADPAEKFIGSWKLAAAEVNGIMVSGDFSQILGSEASLSEIGLTIEKNGTGTMNWSGDTVDLTWTQKDNSTITITANSKSDSGISTVDVTSDGSALQMEMQDESFSGKLIFTADGKYADAKEISADGATPITSEDALIGTWKLTGVNMMGMSMYGNADDLAAALGGVSDTTLTFEAGGTAKAFGADETWTVGADGATITSSGTTAPVKALGNDIVIDASAQLGGTMQILMVFSK